MYRQFYLFSIIALVISSCNNAQNSNKENLNIELEKREVKKQEPQKVKKQPTKNDSLKVKNTFSTNKLNRNTRFKKNNIIEITEDSLSKFELEKNNQLIPIKWKNTYSNDKKWIELYDSSRSFFLNGWRNEFNEHPLTQITKEELLLAYRKRMENIFYETPSFIEFCVNELKVSDEFLTFCKQWKKNIK